MCFCDFHFYIPIYLNIIFGFGYCVDKANRLNVGNASNPRPSDEDKKLVVVKSPNAVNPLVWDYLVSTIRKIGVCYCSSHNHRFV